MQRKITNTQRGPQKGPEQANICKGCIVGYTYDGLHESHHACLQSVWKSVKQTPHNEYPETPSTCPYLNN